MTDPADWPEWIGLGDIAELLGVAEHTAYQWRVRRKLPVPDIDRPRAPLWRRETLAAWDAAGRPPQDA